MKFKYSPDVDILMVWLSEEPTDHADETEGVITHISKKGQTGIVGNPGRQGIPPELSVERIGRQGG